MRIRPLARAEERVILEALVGAEYRRLYLTNAHFKMGLDTFVQFLPFFVAGLAGDAEQKQEIFNAEVLRAVMQGPSPFIVGGTTVPNEKGSA